MSWTTSSGGGGSSGSIVNGDGFMSDTTDTDVNSNGGVSLGPGAGENSPGEDAIAIGTGAGNTSQSTESIAIGRRSGYDSQYEKSIAIGHEAGKENQGTRGDENDSDDDGQSLSLIHI